MYGVHEVRAGLSRRTARTISDSILTPAEQEVLSAPIEKHETEGTGCAI